MYSIELYDRSGLRLASFDDVPLLEATRTAPDRPDRIVGLLPTTVERVSHADSVRVLLDGALFCEASVIALRPQWSDSRKLILERYVGFHEIVEIEAERPARWGDAPIARAYVNKHPDTIVRDAINAARGPIHYTVEHSAYPQGAQREYAKFQARKLAANELQVGGIGAGDWVAAPRIDASGAYAKDGDTIAGLVVDGVAWPDLRLMMVDAEETEKNSHAVARHPEIADWTPSQYLASGYQRSADAAKEFLQGLIAAHGVEAIELNPHRGITGAYDDRVDAYGRYVGLAYGGAMCWNAALIEAGHSDVSLYADGAYLAPEMALKEFYSYMGPSRYSIADASTLVSHLDFVGTVHELITMAGYLAEGFAWHIDARGAVHFRPPERISRVVFHDPIQRGVALGSRSDGIVNTIHFEGNPIYSTLSKSYARWASVDALGAREETLPAYAIVHESDSDLLAETLLNDLAYPEPDGSISFYHGDPSIEAGDAIEVRGLPFRQLEISLAGQWGGIHEGKLVGRVREVTHRFMGRRIETRAQLTSPQRSVADPIAFMTRSQPSESSLFQLRLDDANVGVDLGYHLD